MEKVLDVIIVGAGYAGLAVAAELSKTNLNVLVIEGKDRIHNENPVRGTFEDTIKKYDLGGSRIINYDYVDFFSKNSKFTITGKNKFVMFDSNKLLDILKKRSTCRILTNKEIIDAKKSKEGIVLFDQNGKSYKAKVVVDASGGTSAVAQSFGISKSRVYCMCYYANLRKCSINKRRVLYFTSKELTNGGVWVEPLSDTKCQVGIGDFVPITESTEEEMKMRLFLFIKEYKNAKKYFKNASVVRGSERFVLYPVEPLENMIDDNMIIIGDAAGHATPFLGEGVRPCLEMAEIASKVIKESFDKKSFKKNDFVEYERKWWEMYGNNYLGYIAIRHIFMDMSDKEIDTMTERLNALEPGDKIRFLRSEITPSMLKRMVTKKIGQEMMKGTLRRNYPHLHSLSKKYIISHFV